MVVERDQMFLRKKMEKKFCVSSTLTRCPVLLVLCKINVRFFDCTKFYVTLFIVNNVINKFKLSLANMPGIRALFYIGVIQCTYLQLTLIGLSPPQSSILLVQVFQTHIS